MEIIKNFYKKYDLKAEEFNNYICNYKLKFTVDYYWDTNKKNWYEELIFQYSNIFDEIDDSFLYMENSETIIYKIHGNVFDIEKEKLDEMINYLYEVRQEELNKSKAEITSDQNKLNILFKDVIREKKIKNIISD